MARVAVFDSGLGSLSVIGPIREACRCDIVYFADQKSYPYGQKTRRQLRDIMDRSIGMLRKRFSPDVIVVASNTPSLMLDLDSADVICVRPPLREAQKLSRSGSVGIMATRGAVSDGGLDGYIADNSDGDTRVTKIDATDLVDLVESGMFLAQREACRRAIGESLDGILARNDIDAVTLSSTHLPFLRDLLEERYGDVRFVDPGRAVAAEVCRRAGGGAGSLEIYASGDLQGFQKKLDGIGIAERAISLDV